MENTLTQLSMNNNRKVFRFSWSSSRSKRLKFKIVQDHFRNDKYCPYTTDLRYSTNCRPIACR